MNKFEKLIELIVNEDSKQAKKLFHDIVVEKSRTIYESLLDEDDVEDVEEMEDDVDADEEGLGEGISITVAEAKQLLDHIDGTLKESDAGDLLQRVASHFGVQVEGLIPVLEANGDALLEMAYGEAEEDDFGGEDEAAFGGEEEFGGDGEDTFGGDMEDGGEFAGDEMGIDGGEMDMGGEEEIEDRVVDLEDAIDELRNEFDELIGDDGMDDEGFGDEGDFGGEEGGEEMDDVEDMAGDVASDDQEDEDEDEVEESLVREYVEKKSPKVTTQEEDSPNTKSTVAGKNDMGGSTKNILGDQSEEKGAGAVSSGSNKGAGSFQNDPKAKAGKTSFKKKETAKKADAPESKKSLLDGPKKSGK